MTETPDPAALPPETPRKKTPYTLMGLMGLNILLGMGVALAGHLLLESDGIALAGAALATLGALVMLFFLLWGNKA
jgi:hypothetical protein